MHGEIFVKERLSCDVVIVGSGAGGMMAAIRAHDLGLRSIVIEKSDRYGGTSAVSGGAIWIPNNPHIGTGDSPARALEYLEACTAGEVPRIKLERYIEAAPGMLDYLGQLGIDYYAEEGSSYPDYYPEKPGSLPYGRTMLVRPMNDGGVLGDDFFRMRESYPEFKLLDKVSIDLDEGNAMLHREKGWQRVLVGLLGRYYTDRKWRRKTHRDRRLTIGNALIGGLRKAMLDRDIPLMLSTRLVEVTAQDDRVTGIVADCDGNSRHIDTARGVILASGGFEHSQTLREKHLDQHTEERWSVTPRDNNAGDALAAIDKLDVATEFMNEAWWAPGIAMPSKLAPNTVRNMALFFERGFPHSMAVNRLGKRFVNEIRSYHQFGQAMLADNRETGANLPCWMIFDAQYRRKYPLGGLLPGSIAPDRKLPVEWIDSFLYRADTIEALAAKIGVPGDALAASVARFNDGAKRGVDEDFHRGANVYAQFFGDPSHTPNRVLGPLEQAPFYAVRLDLGDLGTKGGPKTDENGAVIDKQGKPVAGLYAVGNVAGSVMGGAYPGAGATLGSAMTFAYVAAANLARRNSV